MIRHPMFLIVVVVAVSPLLAEPPRVFPAGETPADARLEELRTLDSYFPMKVVEDTAQWQRRKEDIKRRVLISQGLWPEPTKTELAPVIHGPVEFDDYTVERVYFQSLPGHYVTGSLYRPKGKAGPYPAVLCPHGHWTDARFYDAGEDAARLSLASGAERFMSAARNHIQARCVQLARMGCIAFLYDMTGNSDSIQLGHRPDDVCDLEATTDWQFFSVQADLRLQNMMGLQTWNSVRCIDFLLQLDDVDPSRIGVTGASGGGTQSMIIAAIDDRISAAMPCVMVSTSMQGGCTCENAPLLRIDQGNVDIAATIAPRPLGLTAADDWTIELETKGYPELLNLYSMLGHKNRLTAAFHTQFKHNYNHVNRVVMYDFFNRHFNLGFKEPVLEDDFERMTKDQLTVWNDEHPAPSGDQIGMSHETELLRLATQDSDEQIAKLVPSDSSPPMKYREVVGKAWETILGRRLDQVGEVKFTSTAMTTIGGFQANFGRLDHASQLEQLPMVILRSVDVVDRGSVVWISDTGKASLFPADQPLAPVAELLSLGYTVMTADLSGQGEMLPDGQTLDAQRMWFQRKGENAWERFCGYTYGYNHSLMAHRAHDVLTLIKYAGSRNEDTPVHLVGIGKAAGPITLAARSQAADAVDQTIVDLKGFRFVDLKQHDSPMFLPGAVKYMDVAGLLSLCAPHPITIAGLTDSSVPAVVYASSGASNQLAVVNSVSVAELLSR